MTQNRQRPLPGCREHTSNEASELEGGDSEESGVILHFALPRRSYLGKLFVPIQSLLHVVYHRGALARRENSLPDLCKRVATTASHSYILYCGKI